MRPAPRRKGLYAETLKSYLGVVSELEDDSALDRILLRTRSVRGVDLLALWATDGRLRYREILDYVTASDSSWTGLCQLAGVTIHPSRLVRLARVVALQDVRPGAASEALSMLRWLHGQCGESIFTTVQARLYQGLAFTQDEFALAQQLVDGLPLNRLDRLLMRADLANPWGDAPMADAHLWRGHFRELFDKSGIECPHIGEGSALEPFDRLGCTVPETVTDGPLVSVVLTSWCPDEGLVTAVRSILAQSWRNLEVLLVDDASPDTYLPLLQDIAGLDERIRLIRLPANGGTYLARNAALRVATGEFVTGQDSDDWSHPRRVELQVSKLLRNAKLISSTSHALRCDPSMLFNEPGMMARRENASSLMFRRAPVLDALGGYDATRKGGDTEFMLRIARVFGTGAHRLLEANLALIRRSRGSLSNAEFRPGWRHPARAAYRRSYEHWHASQRDDQALKIVERAEQRTFPLPQRFAVDRDGAAERVTHDVVFMDDLRPFGNLGHLRGLLDEIRSAVDAGLRVGVLHMRSFRDIRFEGIDTYWLPISKLIHAGIVSEVLQTDDDAVDLLIVRRPEVAFLMNPEGFVLEPRRTLMVVGGALRDEKGRAWYEPLACQKNMREAVGKTPAWAVSSANRDELARVLGPETKFEEPYPILVDVEGWRAPARNAEGRRLVVGRLANGPVSEIPVVRDEILKAYPASVDVRSMEDKARCAASFGRTVLPTNWRFLPSQRTDPNVFLSSCDLLIHVEPEVGAPPPERAFIEAMASGCVVVASVEHAQAYGGAVVGREAQEVEALLDLYYREPQELRRQAMAGLAYAHEHYGREARSKALRARLGLPAKRSGKRRIPHLPAEHVTSGALAGVPALVSQHVALYEEKGFLREIDRTLLRTGSIQARDILAAMATRGRLGWDMIRRLLVEHRNGGLAPESVQLAASFDIRVARRLARVVALQALLPDDRINALTMYKLLVDVHGPKCLDLQHGKLAADLAFYLQDWGFLEYAIDRLRLKNIDRQFVEADMTNPFAGTPYADGGRWLDLINRDLVATEVAPILVGPVEEDLVLPFDRLRTEPLPEVPSGDLVTVVITSWRPDVALVSAVRSITRQTWRNLEILLIDDASPDDYVPLLERVAASDERIRLIRQPENGGTYLARNRGLSEAKGKYFTVHDSDDWAHPRRIELQVKALLEDGSLVSSASFAYRCSDRLVVNFPGVMPDRENASSLMFELEKVRSRIGYYDASRKGADTEFTLRMRAAFGRDSHRVLQQPLAMIRLSPGSLSRAEFKPGWRHPARAMYRRSYEGWHRGAATGAAHLDAHEPERKFRIPANFQIRRPAAYSTPVLDAVLVADLRSSARPDVRIAHEASSLRSQGFRVGLLHLESYQNPSLREIEPFDSDLEELLVSGLVEEVLYTDERRVSKLLVRDPSVLQFAVPYQSALKTDAVVVVAEHAGIDDHGRHSFCPADCANNAFSMFGVEPRWCGTDEAVVNALRYHVSSRMLDDQPWPALMFEGFSGKWSGIDDRNPSVGPIHRLLPSSLPKSGIQES